MAEAGRLRRIAGPVVAVGLLHLALIAPNRPGAVAWGAFGMFPLELPAILCALVLLPGRATRATVAAALTAMAAVKLADLASHAALGRAFNPVLDVHLAAAGLRLLSGAIGAPATVGLALATTAAIAALGAALWWATGQVAALGPVAGGRRAALGAGLAAAVGLAAIDAAREVRPFDPPGSAFTARLAWEHGRDAARGRADLAGFRREAARDPAAALAPETILASLRGRDVFLIFVESYGRSALEAPLYAPTIEATLGAVETALAAEGLAVRSAWLEAPMVGGQSWLAHASVLSGLRIDSQGRYRALIASPRRTLLHLAQDAGWRTVAVMPAITLAWPEADYFGYDRVLAAADLGYAGPPFNWVTMPDQFTLAAFERAELEAAPRPPVFAEIALISSHAPWTPVPRLLPWEAVGDGSVYGPYAAAGDPPEVVWRDQERVRDQYRQALDYSLQVVGSFLERRAGSGAVAIVLGDHPPARFVSLDPEGFEVPVHVVGPPEALARLDGWGWTPGLLPAADAPVWDMSEVRDRLLAAFAPEAVAACPTPTGPLPGRTQC